MDWISALMDGELQGRKARRELARIEQDPELRRCWDTFHMIGDALRGERALSADFERRLIERLRSEPTVLAPRFRPARRLARYALAAAASLAVVGLAGWIALSEAPQPAAVAEAPAAAPALPVQSAEALPPAAPPVAAAVRSAAISVPGGVQTVPAAASAAPHPEAAAGTAAEGGISEYLIAHHEFSPSTQLQGLAAYIRTVSLPHSSGNQ
jgi:sigma-E factor negative regulatory protein RseA